MNSFQKDIPMYSQSTLPYNGPYYPINQFAFQYWPYSFRQQRFMQQYNGAQVQTQPPKVGGKLASDEGQTHKSTILKW